MDFRRAVVAVALSGLVLAGCRGETTTLGVGETGNLVGLRLSVTKVVVGGDDHGPWFQVWFRMKNISDHEVFLPDAGIVCAGHQDEGGLAPTQDRHYAIRPGARIFVHSSAAGVMRLLAPARPCKAPARVRVTGAGDSIDIRIPDAVVRGLNTY